MIEEALHKYGLSPISLQMVQQLESYLDLLLFWNARQNLTAIRDRTEIVERHIVESIFCAQHLPSIHTLLDFGSGAGLPGLPIAVTRPEIHVTLGESQGKKAAFLREAIRTLQISSTVHSGRVETLPTGRTFDCVTMRAVDKTLDVLPFAWDRVGASGSLIIFATETSAPSIQSALSEANWSTLPALGPLSGGILLTGKR